MLSLEAKVSSTYCLRKSPNDLDSLIHWDRIQENIVVEFNSVYEALPEISSPIVLLVSAGCSRGCLGRLSSVDKMNEVILYYRGSMLKFCGSYKGHIKERS